MSAGGDHEERTRALFRSIARERNGYYDAVPGGPPRLSRWQRLVRWRVQRILDRRLASHGVPGAWRLLDAGCGRGDFSRALTERHRSLDEVVGCDFLDELVALATAATGGTPRLRFVQGDVTALPFAPGAFDVTVCLNVLHHVRGDRLSVALGELARVTGRLLLVEIKNASSLYFRLHSRRVGGVEVFPTTAATVGDLLRPHGLALVRSHPIFGVDRLSPLVLLELERAPSFSVGGAGASRR
jgi:ubiquinone/menaquinone biosynthesis C-methylase UbiE